MHLHVCSLFCYMAYAVCCSLVGLPGQRRRHMAGVVMEGKLSGGFPASQVCMLCSA